MTETIGQRMARLHRISPQEAVRLLNEVKESSGETWSDLGMLLPIGPRALSYFRSGARTPRSSVRRLIWLYWSIQNCPANIEDRRLWASWNTKPSRRPRSPRKAKAKAPLPVVPASAPAPAGQPPTE